MIIGHPSQGYPERRNIIGRIPEYEYRLCRDRFGILRTLRARFRLPYRPDDEFLFDDWGLSSVDLVHTFNHVVLSRRPWIATFETWLPRLPFSWSHWSGHNVGERAEKIQNCALDALADDSCRQLIAISEAAANVQRVFLQRHPAFSGIDSKVTILHPPQAIQVGSLPAKSPGPQIRLALVGHHFVRKGGLEVLRALADVNRERGPRFHLTIVSRISRDGHFVHPASEPERAALEQIQALQPMVTHHRELAAAEVLELFKASDIALLPSFAETYGYSVLEAQACGTPVITTNVRSFPEINNEQCGWIIPLALNERRDAALATAEERLRASDMLVDGLRAVLCKIDDDRSCVDRKGLASLERIQRQHAPDEFAAKLKTIYAAAVRA
jgi:glycosyltransferase involved in cell wall biosynthesis